MKKKKITPSILGYGEDSLTLRLLQNWGQRKALSDQLKEDFDITLNQKKTEVFYRPSFGRGYVGEPDFVIFTRNSNSTKWYWIIGESKWDKSNEISKRNELRLGKGQEVVRIDKLRNLLEFWHKYRSSANGEWAAYYQEIGEAFQINKNVRLKDSTLISTVADFLKRADNFFPPGAKVELLALVLVFIPLRHPEVRFAQDSGSGMKLLNIPYAKGSFINIGFIGKKGSK